MYVLRLQPGKKVRGRDSSFWNNWFVLIFIVIFVILTHVLIVIVVLIPKPK